MGNRSTIKKYISFSKFRNFLENLPRALKKKKTKKTKTNINQEQICSHMFDKYKQSNSLVFP